MCTQWMNSDFSPVTPNLWSRLTVGTPYCSSEFLSVGKVLGHVHVAANSRVAGNPHAFFQRVVRQREGGMQAHHGRDLTIAFAYLGNKAPVLFDTAASRIAV